MVNDPVFRPDELPKENQKEGEERNPCIHMKKRYKVSRGFTALPNQEIAGVADLHAAKIDGNPVFPTPPVKPADLTTQNLTFRDKMTAATGDPQDTAAVNTAREVVLDSLRANANYVEILASTSLEDILSAGFQAASTNHAQFPLDQPVILELSNLAPTQLLLRLTPIVTAKSYQAQTSVDAGKTWQEAGIFTQARRIVLDGLVSGATVMVRARAVGGNTGYSPWCNSGSLVVT